MAVLSALILIVALAGVLIRPRDVHESTWAALGAIAMLVTGSEPLDGAWHVLTANLSVLAFLAGVLALAAAADDAGWFAEGARLAVRGARGSPLRLFVGVCIVSFAGAVLFSLDAAAVALTPVVLIAARRAGATSEPLLFACIAVANTASMALPISNPTNVIVADRVGLDFVAYARTMLPAALAASVAVSLVLGVRFRRELAGTLEAPTSSPGIANRTTALTSAVATALALAGFVLFPRDLGVVALLAGAGAATTLVTAGRWSLGRTFRATGPRLLVFALGVFVMVDAVERHGLRDLIARHRPGTASGVGVLAAALSNVVNNLPATVISLPLVGLDPERAYALLAGVDAGPNLTLSGSLATLLWLAAARDQGTSVSPRRYLAVGALTAPAGLAAALVTLELIR
ncbi:MAG: arsenical pump rane protein [Gaiellales bacterium]|jgi:arsenical pump membrane protein|nr:arsenical pump rane protein [Gaiellales bacterium]